MHVVCQPQRTAAVPARARAAGLATLPPMQIYLVGGAVRDRLLGRPGGDRDWVVVGSTPDAMVAAGFRPVGKDFPVFLHPDTQDEYARRAPNASTATVTTASRSTPPRTSHWRTTWSAAT